MEVAAQYENLRARALGQPVQGRPTHGLAILLRAGVPAWVAQLQRSITPLDRQSIGPQLDHPPFRRPIGDVATTIVILASMVLAAQAEWSP